MNGCPFQYSDKISEVGTIFGTACSLSHTVLPCLAVAALSLSNHTKTQCYLYFIQTLPVKNGNLKALWHLR